MNKVELAWLAGLMDAEGCFHVGKNARQVRLSMTDRDVVEAVHKLTQCKLPVRLKPPTQAHYQVQYEDNWYGHNAINLSLMVAPLMSDRRREKIQELTGKYSPSIWNTLHYQEKLAWVAGYVEGEATFCHVNTNGYVKPKFCVSTTDIDAVARVGALLDLKLCFNHRKESREGKWKVQYRVSTMGRPKTRQIGNLMMPFMFSKKRSDITHTLSLPTGRQTKKYVRVA